MAHRSVLLVLEVVRTLVVLAVVVEVEVCKAEELLQVVSTPVA